MYIYTCIYTNSLRWSSVLYVSVFRSRRDFYPVKRVIRPIPLLTLSLLTLLDSNFPGSSLWAWEFHPFKLRLCWSQTL